MDFKKLAQDKLDKISGFKSNTDESEFDNILEGLDLEIESVRKIDENQIELDLDDELDFEPVSKSNDQQIQNLFDGYIGEKNFVPNPYEYGPNATYRNVNEGIVYKKNSENLWEAFVKDGKSGQQGPRGFAGGGTGVEEVKRIINQYLNIYIDSSGTIHSTNPIIAPNFTFSPTYISGTPQTSSMQISAGSSQRVLIPQGKYVRITWTGFGPFAYRQGDSSVVAISTDSIGLVGYQIIAPVIAPYFSVYGIGSGTVYLEGGE